MIYENIAVICKERGLSIRELEAQAGLGNGTVSGWRESSPRVDKLQAVADVLDVPLTSLIEKEETA